MNPRSTKQGPFCWQSKAVRRAIRERFDAINSVATALSLYDAMTEEASNKQAETFTTTHAWLQMLSGVSPSTIKKHLKAFADMGIVTVKECPGLRGPSTYTLLANGCLTLANGTPNDALATSEESPEESKEESPEQSPAPAAPDAGMGNVSPVGDSSKPRPITPEDIFAAYPKRTAKNEAVKAIKAALKSADAEHVLSATKAYARATSIWKPEDRKFIPAPAKWFAAGCYDDDQKEWNRNGRQPLDPEYDWDSPEYQERQGPPGWRDLLAKEYPDNAVVKENRPWREVPDTIKRKHFDGWRFDSRLNKWRSEKGITFV